MVLSLALGLVIGLVLALTGAGGGILAVPLLVFGAHMDVAHAGPIGLMAVGIAAGFGALMGLKSSVVRYRAAVLMALAGMLMSPMGLWLAHHTNNDWLSVLFAGVLLYVAFRTFKQAVRRDDDDQQLLHPCVRSPNTGRLIWTRPCAQALVASGLTAGLLSGLLGVGGGFVVVPTLRRYTDLEMQSIVATSLAVIALVSITGVVSSSLSGAMDWNVALPFAAGTLIGMVGGRAMTDRLAGAHLQIGFALISGAVALGMIGRAALTA